MKELTRRNLLKTGIAAVGTVAATTMMGKAMAETCGVLTPSQTPGPFYPDQDNDLTHIVGRTETAAGQRIYLVGRMEDQNCNPVNDAVVEIWQTNAHGRYHHDRDSANSAPLDKNFQYFGLDRTNNQGHFRFKSVMPRPYPASANWMRPAHIHVKVHKVGVIAELTTQLYFKGDRFIAGDRIVQSLSKAEQDNVIIDFKRDASLPEADALLGPSSNSRSTSLIKRGYFKCPLFLPTEWQSRLQSRNNLGTLAKFCRTVFTSTRIITLQGVRCL